MFKALILLFICVKAHAYIVPVGCYSEAQSKFNTMKSKNLGLSKSVEDAISDNLYYFCDLNLSGADSWVCIDRSSTAVQKKSEIIHISPEYEIWFEGKNDEAQRPEISLYREEHYLDTARFNTFNLDRGFVLTLEKNPRNYRLSGMAVDNREGRDRSFKNIECFDVKGITEKN